MTYEPQKSASCRGVHHGRPGRRTAPGVRRRCRDRSVPASGGARDQPAHLRAFHRTPRRRDLRRHLGGPRFEDSQPRRHSSPVRRRHEAHRRAELPLARRLLRRRLPLARRHRPRRAPPHLQLLAEKHAARIGPHRDQPVRHSRVHPSVPPDGRRALPGGERGVRVAAGIPRLGALLQRSGEHRIAGRRARRQRRPRAVRREVVGRRQRELGMRRRHEAAGVRHALPALRDAVPGVSAEALPGSRGPSRPFARLRPGLDHGLLRSHAGRPPGRRRWPFDALLHRFPQQPGKSLHVRRARLVRRDPRRACAPRA